MKNLSHIVAAAAAGALAFISVGLANVAYADTRIGGIMSGDQHFTKAGSPYHLTGDVFITDHTLLIDPGVVIDSVTPGGWSINLERAHLIMNGTPTDRIKINHIWGFYTSSSTLDISYADILTQGPLYSYTSRITIATSSVTSYGIAMDFLASNVTITGSMLAARAYTILITPTSLGWTYLAIHGSSIRTEQYNSIDNIDDAGFVNAENNWWGSPNGPPSSGPNSTRWNVSTYPWLTEEPTFEWQKVCCSNVLFLPGLESTRLYNTVSLPLGLGSQTQSLWEPLSNAAVSQLHLTYSGSSTDPTVYSDKPISKAYGLITIYDGFMKLLDGLVSDKSIRSWRGFGYDWRKPINQVVAGEEKRSTTTESLIDVVTSLATNSKTGKVSIVAHSNGGLIAKYLVKTLAEMGKADLIDTVISVAVPYIGTPEAIAGLLHGDHQSIAHGLIVSQAAARLLGQNMPSAYTLVPSFTYFANKIGPTIVLASSTLPGIQYGMFRNQIATPMEQNDFITNRNSYRSEGAPDDVSMPIGGNNFLYIAADMVHQVIDPFVWPLNIARYALVGTNADTTSHVLYSARATCLLGYIGLPCPVSLTHSLSTTKDGDGTVVAPSAMYNSGTTTAIDLGKIVAGDGRVTHHADILESSTTQSLIKSILTTGSTPEILPTGTALRTTTSFVTQDSSDTLVVSTHSPVELHVYDSVGHHTGVIPKPSGLVNNDYVVGAFEEGIPGSSFNASESSDGYETYIRLPITSQPYTIALAGTGLGYATLDIEKSSDGNVTDSIEYSMFAVSPLSIASSSIVAMSGQTLASSTAGLVIDAVGDGSHVETLLPNPGHMPAPNDSFDVMRSLVQTLAANDPHHTQILQRIDHLKDLANKGKLKPVQSQSASFLIHIGHMKLKDVASDKRTEIISTIEKIIKDIETGQ